MKSKQNHNASIAGIDVTAPISLQRLAPILGYRTYQLRRILQRLDNQCGGRFLTKVNGRIMVTIVSLREFWPEFARRIPSEADVRMLSEEQHTLEIQMQRISKGMQVLASRMKVLENKLERMNQKNAVS